MAWIYFLELEESASHSAHGCGRSAMSKSTNTAKELSGARSVKGSLRMHRSGMMSPRSTPILGLERWISLQADSPARISAQRERAQDWKESEADYFSRSCGSPVSSDLHSYFSKMFQQSLLGEEEPSSARLHQSGMTRGGEYYQLSMWERRTSGKDGGVWLGTPRATIAKRSEKFGKGRTPSPEEFVEMWPTPTQRDWKGGSAVQVEKPRSHQLNDAVMWPTPVQYDAIPGGPNNHYKGLGHMAKHGEIPGQLNPEFVEWLMNYPKGWTVVEPHGNMGNKTTKEKHHAKNKKTGPGEVLPVMRKTPQAETLRPSPGGYGGVQTAEILRPPVHGAGDGGGKSKPASHSASHQKTPGAILRILRRYQKPLHSSHRRRLEEQRPIQLKDALRIVSYVLAPPAGGFDRKENETAMLRLREAVISSGALQYASDPIEAAWKSASGEEKEWAIVAACFGGWWAEWPGVGRVASGVEKRVDRLKRLGNSVVPATAREAFRRLAGIQ